MPTEEKIERQDLVDGLTLCVQAFDKIQREKGKFSRFSLVTAARSHAQDLLDKEKENKPAETVEEAENQVGGSPQNASIRPPDAQEGAIPITSLPVDQKEKKHGFPRY